MHLRQVRGREERVVAALRERHAVHLAELHRGGDEILVRLSRPTHTRGRVSGRRVVPGEGRVCCVVCMCVTWRTMNAPFFFALRISSASGSKPGAMMPSHTSTWNSACGVGSQARLAEGQRDTWSKEHAP